MAKRVHYTNLDLIHYVRVALVGAGGNGSQMLTGLARLDAALRGVGSQHGLFVTVWDGDTVSESNVGRQLFYAADAGQSKSVVLVNRVNACFGTDWRAEAANYSLESAWNIINTDVLITCTDTLSSRQEIFRSLERTPSKYWLDLGNRQRDGQVVLGQLQASPRLQGTVRGESVTRVEQPRLPHLFDLYPELLTAQEEDEEPSCSMAEALGRQDLFINDHVTRWALHLLWTMLRYGQIEHHGYFVNLESGTVNPLPVPAQLETTL
jgi:PRTRC genetic system ThiF family protein